MAQAGIVTTQEVTISLTLVSALTLLSPLANPTLSRLQLEYVWQKLGVLDMIQPAQQKQLQII